MDPKFLIIPLMILMICSLTIGDPDPNALAKSRENRDLQNLIPLSVLNPLKKARAFVSIINDMTTLILGIDGMKTLLTQDNSEQEFKDFTKAKLEEIVNMTKKIDGLTQQVADVKNAVRESTELIILETVAAIDRKFLHDKKEMLDSVENTYDAFATHQNNFVNYNKQTMRDYLTPIVHGTDLKNYLQAIQYATELPTSTNQEGHENIFGLVISCLEKEIIDHQICDSVPNYDKFFMFYEYVLKTVTKGYTMLILANQYLQMATGIQDFHEREIEILRRKHLEAIVAITTAAQHYITSVDKPKHKLSYACDPKNWKEGQHFIRVKNYVANSYIRIPEDPGYTGEQIKYDCTTKYFAYSIDSPDWSPNPYNVVAMPCTDPFHPDYNYLNGINNDFELLDHLSYERIIKKTCVESILNPSYYKSLCDEDVFSDPFFSIRKLSTRPQSCDLSNNEVVTNVRFVEFGGIIRPEIQCGVYSDGTVDPSTLKWNTEDRQFTYKNFPRKDYIIIGHPVRKFNLDDILMSDGQLVTAIKFEKKDGFISLNVQGKKMYITDTTTELGETEWHKPEESSQRTEIKINELPLAVNQTQQTHEESKPGRNFIKVVVSNQRSDFRAANPIVPFFDMKSYQPPILAPLGGLGIFYKSNPGQAGLLAFKIISPRYKHHINNSQS